MLKYLLLFVSFLSFAQRNPDSRVIVITTDGFRWQEVFKGMDSSIVKMKRFHHGDSATLIKQYWAPTIEERRAKLLPFIWGELAQKGQIHGNRVYQNYVNVKNPHWFSYPGYSELLTGQMDSAVNSNEYKSNPHTNFFEYLQSLPAYKGQVIAFGAWDAFDRILNEKRAGFPVVNAFDKYPSLEKDPEMKMLAGMLRDSYKPFGRAEALDVFTHYKAMHYLKTQKPKAMYISYGETDEFAHEGHYGHYLNAAHQFDAWLQEIWHFVNSDPAYKGKTTLLITTDHGRGDRVNTQWTSHGSDVPGADEIWYAMIAPQLAPLGEIKKSAQIHQKDLIHLLGFDFKSEIKP